MKWAFHRPTRIAIRPRVSSVAENVAEQADRLGEGEVGDFGIEAVPSVPRISVPESIEIAA